LERRSERQLNALQEERWTVAKMRLLWKALDRERLLVPRKLMCMPDDAPGSSALTAHFHSILAAMRTIDCALVGDID
jgi:hypothetical protein